MTENQKLGAVIYGISRSKFENERFNAKGAEAGKAERKCFGGGRECLEGNNKKCWAMAIQKFQERSQTHLDILNSKVARLAAKISTMAKKGRSLSERYRGFKQGLKSYQTAQQ